jgi:ubiquinone/menaquinone biosynthesis C-methylase UbiE
MLLFVASSHSFSLSSHQAITDTFGRPKYSTLPRTVVSASIVVDQEERDPLEEPEQKFFDEKPGKTEDPVFQCDESVSYWKDFDSQGSQGNLQRMIDIISNDIMSSNLARAYWGSHILRTGYFTVNAALGTVFSDLHETFIANNQNKNPLKGSSSGSSILFSNNDSMLQKLVETDVPSRLVLECCLVYSQEYKYIKDGLLKFPWDALIRESGVQLNHRQSNPFFALTETVGTIRESVAIFSRRNKQSSKGVFLDSKTSDDIYPNYYLNDFHYQTDGWLSSDSAKQYEVSTETLFLGRQDAMQRQTLIPILRSGIQPDSILEVACGTGRFGTFTRDNFPTAEVTYSDLSPYYLEKAKDNDKYWISQRGEDAMEEAIGEKKKPEPATFVQANAEKLPFDDESFDVVTCVYLFHELPEEARTRAAAEMIRVLKPGGMIVLTDSNQLGDRPPMDDQMGNFSYLNEPHYSNYINTHLPVLFEGCDCGEKMVASSSKTLSFIKKTT